MACVENAIVPIPPKDWTPPTGWRPPNEKNDSTSKYAPFNCWHIFYFNLPVLSTTALIQQSIMSYGQKAPAISKQIPVTKDGIKEHLLAIVTTCDLVSSI